MSMATPGMTQAIQDAMRKAFPEVESRVERFYAMQQYHLGWRDPQLEPTTTDPGKLLRPYLALLACQAVGGQIEQALPLAAGIQLLHDFTLVHDDIQDVSATRRGRPTLWSLWGVAHGITAGDSLFALAHLVVHQLTAVQVPAATVLEVLRRLDETILAVCEGQYLDCSQEGDLSVTEDAYMAMICRKTATLLGSATALGALIGGTDSASVQGMYEFGLNLGLAFQIRDDLLGIWGDPKATGKPAASDLYRRKVTLPIIRAVRFPKHAAALSPLYRREEISDADVEQMLAILSETGIRSEMERQLQRMAESTLQILDGVAFPAAPGSQQARNQLMATVTALLAKAGD